MAQKHVLTKMISLKFICLLAQNEVKLYEWSSWEDWSSCSVSCGQGGRKKRSRKCIHKSNQFKAQADATRCIREGQGVLEEDIACNEDIRCSRGYLSCVIYKISYKNAHWQSLYDFLTFRYRWRILRMDSSASKLFSMYCKMQRR